MKQIKPKRKTYLKRLRSVLLFELDSSSVSDLIVFVHEGEDKSRDGSESEEKRDTISSSVDCSSQSRKSREL